MNRVMEVLLGAVGRIGVGKYSTPDRRCAIGDLQDGVQHDEA